jgi:histidinol dehydrogenase
MQTKSDTQYRNESIVKRSNDHERNVHDLLRTVKKAGQDAMVWKLEMDLVETRERRVRAEKVLEGLEEVRRDLGRMTEKVLELDDGVVDVVRRLSELGGGEMRED